MHIAWGGDTHCPTLKFNIRPLLSSTLFFVIMSVSVLIGLLSRANTGNELLEILDTFVED